MVHPHRCFYLTCLIRYPLVCNKRGEWPRLHVILLSMPIVADKNATKSEDQLHKYSVTVGKKPKWHDMMYHSSFCSINNIVTSSWIYTHNSFTFHFADFSEIHLKPAQLFNGIIIAVIRMNLSSITWADLSRSLNCPELLKTPVWVCRPHYQWKLHSQLKLLCKRYTNVFW